MFLEVLVGRIFFQQAWEIMVLIFALIIIPGHGQVPEDARSRAMGKITTLPNDSWAAGNNPSGLSSGKGIYVTFSTINRYLVKELKDISFSFRYDLNGNGVGIAGFLSGFSPFLKQWYAVSYGRKWGQYLRTGLSLIYCNLKVSDQLPAFHTATFKLGISSRVNDRLELSFLGVNPFGLSYSSAEGYHMPSQYTGGISYQVNEKILVAGEIESDATFKIVVKSGLEYGFRDRFFLRIGGMSSPFRITSGVGIKYSRVTLDISTEYHSFLGFSPGLSIVYQSVSSKDDRK
jgi:hypothetical protein